MKNYFCFILLLATLAWNATYYFSASSGLDARTSTEARNSNTPWKTLSKLNSIMATLLPGDSVLFKCGDTFYGSIAVTRSGSQGLPIVFSSYGSGSKPVISGFSALTAWTSLGGNRWESTTCDSCGPRVNLLSMGGNPLAMGRYPNADAPEKGYLYFETVDTGTSTITDNQLTAAPNWVGGEIVLRSSDYTLDRCTILSHSGISVSYTRPGYYMYMRPGYGYFIQDHPQTLDAFGEWYYNPSTKKVLFYGDVRNPSTLSMAVSAKAVLMSINGNSFIRITGLAFEGANQIAIQLSGLSSIAILDCRITLTGIKAVEATNVSDYTMEGCQISHSQSNGVSMTGMNHVTFRNNTVRLTGVMAGMGQSSIGPYRAFSVEGNNVLWEYNVIDSTGYIPINFQGDTITVKNNFIDHFCFQLMDGGAIYTWNSCPERVFGLYGIQHYQRSIIGNIVLNGIGANEGTPSKTYSAASGVYLDDNSMNVEITGNTVAHCGLNGAMIHNSFDNVIQGNTFFDNRYQLYMQGNASDYGCSETMQNNTVRDNVLFSRLASQWVMGLTADTLNRDVTNYGDFSGNFYCRPLAEGDILFTSVPDKWTSYTLTAWQQAYGQDLTTRPAPFPIAAYVVDGLVGANKFTNGAFSTSAAGVGPWIDINLGSHTLEWVAAGPLDGGCLKYRVVALPGQNPQGLLVLNVGAIDSTKDYLLRFSLKGSKPNQPGRVWLRHRSGYHLISEPANFLTDTVRKEVEFLFSPRESAEGDIQFTFYEADSMVWLDNIELIEARATQTNPDDYIRFEYNASTTPKSISLAGSYVDAKGVIYDGSIILPPYGSTVLMKRAATGADVHAPLRPVTLSRFPNPAADQLLLSSDYKISRVILFDIRGRAVLSLKPDAMRVTVGLKNLAPGIYFVRSRINHTWVTEKIVRQ